MILKVGFIKQDIKKNFITNLAIALKVKINFIQQAGMNFVFDIFDVFVICLKF